MKQLKNLLFILWATPLSIFFVACGKEKTVFEKSYDIKNHQWSYTDTLDFTFDIADTMSIYDIVLSIKHTPQYPKFQITLGDTGIFATKIKCLDVERAFESFKKRGANVLSKEIESTPNAAERYFWVKDPYDNLFQIVEVKKSWFQKTGKMTGGVFGVVMGTTDIERTTACSAMSWVMMKWFMKKPMLLWILNPWLVVISLVRAFCCAIRSPE